MGNKYLSLGIDHGTTNSSIAVMDGEQPRVIRPNGVDEIMPSAVYVDRRGRTLIGQPAIKAMMINPSDEGIGYTGYKIRIGQDDRYDFGAAQKVLTAPQLGATVIGELLKAYREEADDDPKACVITIPAKFEQSACEGTRKAAELAGLKHSPLLAEPIAAAMAYSFSTSDERAHWIVFDLGGGTLDVSLVIVRNGRMVVPEEGHAGDNRLGGRKFDRELFAHALEELAKQYALKSFAENNPAYRTAWGKLMLAVEQAKIELSKREEAVIETDGVLCKDERGAPVKVEVRITRAQYEKMIAADVEKAANICQTLLNRNKLTAKDVDRLILIGGPTKTPYLQRVLRDRLKIQLDDSIDPMTAVARGAALYATTMEMPEELRAFIAVPEMEAGAVSLELQYERKSRIDTQNIAGQVTGEAVDEGGLSVEIRRADGLWTSGRLPVDEFGMFSANIQMLDRGKPHQSRFTTTVYDRAGKALASVEEPEVWYPYPDVKISLANSLRVAIQGNQTAVLVKQGAELPARGSDDDLVTTKAIRKGSSEDILRIPVLESVTHFLGEEDPHADCSVHVGSIHIAGSDRRVKRDLPAESAIELTIHQDESREIRAIAYVPLLDEEFEATFKGEAFEITLDQIEQRFEGLKLELGKAEKLQGEKPLPEAAQGIKTIHDLEVLDGIAKQLARARQGERDACYIAYTDVLKLAGALNYIGERQREVRIQQRVAELERASTQVEKENLEAIKSELAGAAGDDRSLTRVEQSLDDIDIKMRRAPYFDLLVDLMALNGRRVSLNQAAVCNRANDLFNRIDDKGGISAMTDSDRAELTAMHLELMRTFPELPQWRQETLDKLPRGEETDPTDIKRARG